MRVWLATLLVVATLAGCADSASPRDDGAPPSGFLAAGSDDLTGGISGVVVDGNVVPIAGATVTLQSSTAQSVTDAEGRFAFDKLEPGVYFLDINATKFLATQQSAQVVAGETVKIKVSLLADPTPDPYHETFPFKGQINFHATVAWAQLEWMLDTYAGVNTPACNCVFTFEPSGKPQGHLYEAVWKEGTEDPRGPSSYYWSYAVPEPYQELFGYAPSPIYKTWGEDAFPTESEELKVMLLGDEDWIAVDQQFEIFLTLWYNSEVPDGWSVVGGDS